MLFYTRMQQAGNFFAGFMAKTFGRGSAFRWLFTVVLLCCLFVQSTGAPALAAASRSAEPSTSDGVRRTTILVEYTEYRWWVIRWFDNQTLCSVTTDHEGLPKGDEIFRDCGRTIYALWLSTPPCSALSNAEFSTKQCAGVYLHLVGYEPKKKEIEVELPAPKAWISLDDCPQYAVEKRCDHLPSLLIEGEEPLPNESITAVHVLWNDQEYTCLNSSCKIPMQATPRSGAAVEFWVDSSFGDSSERFTAMVRVLDSGVSFVTDGGWYVDVLSSQWKGKPLEGCAQIWDVFPPIQDAPGWLKTPALPELLASDEEYYYLAGRLIAQGLVEAKDCPSGGLLSNGYADACGLEKALPLVQEWQNQFDHHIIQASQESGIPAQLMKNMMAQESQFWPGAFKDPNEFGLGQLTDNGAETLLLWNPSFFYQFCPLVLDKSNCERGYVYLDEENQALLRGALALKASVDCPTCEAGIDLSRIDRSIDLFAQTLLANCSQVSRIIYNATSRAPADVSDYVNLWLFTIANYHIGPGCLSYAVYQASALQAPITWESVSTYLTEPCQGVIDYVAKVTR